MEYEKALDLFEKLSELQRGRFVDSQRRLEPLFEVRLDGSVVDCEGWPIRSWRVRVTPSRKLDSAGLSAEDVHKMTEVVRQSPDSANIEFRLENSALELT